MQANVTPMNVSDNFPKHVPIPEEEEEEEFLNPEPVPLVQTHCSPRQLKSSSGVPFKSNHSAANCAVRECSEPTDAHWYRVSPYFPRFSFSYLFILIANLRQNSVQKETEIKGPYPSDWSSQTLSFVHLENVSQSMDFHVSSTRSEVYQTQSSGKPHGVTSGL